MRKSDPAGKGKPMGRVRVERISLRDERSHSEGISLSQANGQRARARMPAAYWTLGKISLTLTKICFGEAAKKKKKERKPPRREERKKDAPRVRGYSSYLIESGRARRSAGGDTESRVTIDRRKELVDKVNGSPRFRAALGCCCIRDDERGEASERGRARQLVATFIFPLVYAFQPMRLSRVLPRSVTRLRALDWNGS